MMPIPRRFAPAACSALAAAAFSIGILALSPGAAQATPLSTSLSAADALSGFNLVVFGDLDSSSEVEGRAYIGGDLTGTSSNFNIHGGETSPSGLPALVVGGNVTGGAKQVGSGGDAVIGGDLAAQINMNGGGTRYVQGTLSVQQNGPASSTVQGPVSLPDIEASLKTLSGEIAAIETNSTLERNGNRATFRASADPDGLAVFAIDGGIFDQVGEIGFDLGHADTIVINVGGLVIHIAENFLGSGKKTMAGMVIWNFFEAETIDFGTEFFGAVLAPYAAISNSNALNGTVVAESFRQRGEVHLPEFSGDLPETVVIGEPSTRWILGSSLVAFGLIGRKLTRRPRRYVGGVSAG